MVFKAHLDVADLNHHRYEHKDVTVALLPREDLEHFLLKLIGFCLLPLHSAAWSKNNDNPIHPDLSLKDEFNRYILWIEVGSPTQKRLERAMQQAEQVIVITLKNSTWLTDNEAYLSRKHIKLLAIDTQFLNNLSQDMTQRFDWSVVVEQNTLTITNNQGFYETNFTEEVALNYLSSEPH